MRKINTSIIKNACIFSLVNRKEAFVYQYSNGDVCFSNLKALTNISINIDRNVKVIYNVYRIKNSHYIRIVDMNTGDGVGYYDTCANEFFKE